MSDKQTDAARGFQVTDKRFWVADETAIDRASAPETKYPSFVEELKARSDAAEAKLREKVQRLDEENAAYRNRLNRQLEERVLQEKAAFALELLEVVDNLERAFLSSDQGAEAAALRDGVALNLNLLLAKLRRWDVEPVETLGREFDPGVAEAVNVVRVENPEEDNRVVEVVRKGYRQGDRILRPALVQVGRYPGEAGVDGRGTGDEAGADLPGGP